ncbi:hypothetical protein C2U72_25240 [Prosthecomicrobium hirschii]|uniref:hypothetical protein n=1 Tax=Prosthecodimorpha hirschii TaxID=665126 RepID=UPI00112A7EEB|nr:hypothetical protein [Prosthecomicrobium hirschii]TPQ46840.1 hypothetical protein C2U72_25240 [Prosthecomicrobium hirschii]
MSIQIDPKWELIAEELVDAGRFPDVQAVFDAAFLTLHRTTIGETDLRSLVREAEAAGGFVSAADLLAESKTWLEDLDVE